jgi:hypothetical protein
VEIFNTTNIVIAAAVTSAAGSDVSVRMLDFPLTGECAEPQALAAPQDTGLMPNGCSPLAITGCAAALAGITVACGGPEDLPCIAAGLAAISGCGSCVCQLIGYDCSDANNITDDGLPVVEFGTCSELGFVVPQDSLTMTKAGFDVEVHVRSQVVDVKKSHVLGIPMADSCSEFSSSDQSNLPANVTVGAGSCMDAGFPIFDSFALFPAMSNSSATEGGCSPLAITGCTAALVGITVACGGPEDLPCIAAGLAVISGCGACVCQLIGYDCTSAPFPVEIFNTTGIITV